MSCRDVQRVVSEYCLLGEQDGLTAPHLEHLSTCRTCRDGAGVDRALVRELRRALAARVAGEAPSPGVWQAVLRRAQEEPVPAGWRAWLRLRWPAPVAVSPFMGRVRTASVLSTMALAVLMANGQNSMPQLPSAPPTPPSGTWNPWERPAPPPILEAIPTRIEISLVKRIADRVTPPPAEDEERLLRAPVVSRPTIDILRAADAAPADEEEAIQEDADVGARLVWQLYPAALDPASSIETPAVVGDESPPVFRSQPGEPS